MRMLALDLGNSALKGGLVVDGRISGTFRIPHPPAEAESSLETALRALPEPAEAAVLVSVVPKRNDALIGLVSDVLGIATVTVHAGSRWPFRIGYATPETLGLDRLAACAGAYTPGRALVVLDAGTALTLDVVTAGGVYLGGAIAPGPTLLMQSLTRGTAQLPEVPLVVPASPIGRSTAECLQSGVMGLFIEGAHGLLHETLRALGEPAHVVATGGWATLLSDAIPEIEAVRPHLVLQGAARVAQVA